MSVVMPLLQHALPGKHAALHRPPLVLSMPPTYVLPHLALHQIPQVHPLLLTHARQLSTVMLEYAQFAILIPTVLLTTSSTLPVSLLQVSIATSLWPMLHSISALVTALPTQIVLDIKYAMYQTVNATVNLAQCLLQQILVLLPEPEVLQTMLSVLQANAPHAMQLLDKPPHALLDSAPLVPPTKLPMLLEYATLLNALPPVVLALPTSKDAQPMVSVSL
jgi:hypothetical protein